MLLRILTAASLSLFALTGCGQSEPVPSRTATGLAGFALEPDRATRWKLPQALREISGLAVLDELRVLFHDDEVAVVFTLDVSTGEVTRFLQLGDPPLAADLEGIAVMDEVLYLIDSFGRVYAAPLPGTQTGPITITDFAEYDTALDEFCEVEGLSENRKASMLMIACKKHYDLDDEAAVYRYSPGGQAELAFTVSLDSEDPPSLSGITPSENGYTLVAARQRLLLEVTETGELLYRFKLRKKHHRQPEGIVYMDGNRLLISDEGEQNKGRITLYER